VDSVVKNKKIKKKTSAKMLIAVQMANVKNLMVNVFAILDIQEIIVKIKKIRKTILIVLMIITIKSVKELKEKITAQYLRVGKTGLNKIAKNHVVGAEKNQVIEISF